MLAFALVAAVAARYTGRDRALALGLLAGAFATLPDVDMLYAPVGLLWADGGPLALAKGFWGASSVVHRAATHSLVVAVVAAPAFAAVSRAGWPRVVGGCTLGALVAWSGLASGVLGALVVGAFAVGGAGVATLAGRFDVSPRSVLLTALVGLTTHPFGDLFTGTPPRLLYPFEATLLTERIALSPDPTLHLVGAMLVELGTFWLAAVVYLHLTDQRLADYLDPTAALGLPSGGAALAVPAPTLSLSYPFVFTVLGLGVACGVGVGGIDHLRSRDRHRTLAMALTALATVTVAVLVYLAAYLAV
nr:metal-dependent hydrolase [Halomarina salina]